MTQKKPNQTPESIRTGLERMSITSADPDRIISFINTACSQPAKMPSMEDSQSAATFLFELIQAAKHGEDWNLYKKRLGVKGSRKLYNEQVFNPDLVSFEDEEYKLVKKYIEKKITPTKACRELMILQPSLSERTAQRCIATIKKRIVRAK